MGIDNISPIGSSKMPVINQNTTSKENTVASSTIKIDQIDKGTEAVKDDQPTKDKMNKMIEGMNEFIKPTHTSLKFMLHDKLNEYYVEVVDSQTNKVIKEIPPKKFLDMYASMLESVGLLVDHKI